MAAVLDPRRGDAVGEQRAVGMPQLSNDLADAQVAVEALLAGRAECAVERAPGLRRDAQRSAVAPRSVGRGTRGAGSASAGDAGGRVRGARIPLGGRIPFGAPAPRRAVAFRDVDGFDRVRVADVEQPFARAVGRGRVAHYRRGANLGIAGERFARRFGEIAHQFDPIGQPMMDPAQRLPGTKRFFAALGEKAGHRGGVEVEKVDHCRNFSGGRRSWRQKNRRFRRWPYRGRPTRGPHWRRSIERNRRGSFPGRPFSGRSRPSGRDF